MYKLSILLLLTCNLLSVAPIITNAQSESLPLPWESEKIFEKFPDAPEFLKDVHTEEDFRALTPRTTGASAKAQPRHPCRGCDYGYCRITQYFG